MPQSRDYKARNIVRSALNEPWAIYEPKLEQIVEFLELRANGWVADEEHIRATIAEQRGSLFADLAGEGDEEGGPVIVDGVQVMRLFGTLGPRMNLMMQCSGGTSTQQFAAEMERAGDNPCVQTILIEVDSPGGVVSGTEEARQSIKRAREKGKRVVVVARNMMASAAYYIGAAATEVFASPSTEVGSIGVYTILKNITKAADDAGIKFHVFRAGDLKAAGNAYEELSAERKKSIQDRIDGAYRMFVNAVAEDRGKTVAEVEASFGRGSVMLAEAAKAVGMIDDVRLIEDVFEQERNRNRAGVAARTGIRAQESERMNDKIKAALFARNLIASLEDDGATCQGVLAAWFDARGQAVPKGEDEILKALTNGTPDPAKAAANVVDAHHRELEEARAEARAAEAKRWADLEASATLLNEGRETPVVTAEMLKDAKASDRSHAEIASDWLKKAGEQEPPVKKGTVNVTGEGEDQWAADAVDAMAYGIMRANQRHDLNARPEVKRLANAPLLHFAKQSLRFQGAAASEWEEPEDIAARAMDVPGADRKVASLSPEDGILASGGDIPYARPGAFPNLLSNLANVIIDDAIQLADKKYRLWTAEYASGLPNFKSVPIVNKGTTDQLDEVMDAEDFKQLSISEECLSWLYLRRFGNAIGFTPVLIANDDRNQITEDAYALGEAWETTVNRLCLNLITGNVALLDEYDLFDDTNHSNHQDSGAAPSDTEWAALETKLAAQTGIDTTQTIEATLNTLLCPTGAVAQAARRTFWTYEQLRESKVAATTANIGLYRGQVDVIPEPALNASSTKKWYAFADPTQFRRATVIRAYFRGFGTRGRRERWYEPKNKTTWVSLEGRVGAAVKTYRYAILDDGE